jgi:hypothetical protein
MGINYSVDLFYCRRHRWGITPPTPISVGLVTLADIGYCFRVVKNALN